MSQLSKNILYNLIGQSLLMVLGFVAVKYVFKQLGEDALGVIYFTLTLNAVLCAALEMGICSTTTREVSAHLRDDPAYIRNLIRTASLFYWTVYGLLAVLIYFVAPVLVENWILLKTMDMAAATHTLQILGIAALLALPHSLYSSLFRGLQRMEFNNMIDVATSGLQQFGTIIILANGGSLFQVVYWFAACFGFGILFYLIFSARFFSWKALMPGFSSTVIRRNLGFAFNMTSISILAMVHTQADKIIASKLLPIGTLGYYGTAWSLVSKATMITGAVSQAAFPSFSALYRLNNRAEMLKQFRSLHDFLCLAMAPLFAAISFIALPLFAYLFNGEVAQMLLLPTALLCIGYYLNGTLTVPYIFSLATGRPEITVKLNFLALFTILPATIALVYFFGLLGAAFSWVLYHLFAYSYVVPKICTECLETPAKEWYLHLLKIFVLIGVTYGIARGALVWIDTSTLPMLLIAYAAASAAYIGGAFWIMGKELREIVYSVPQLMKFRTAAAP